MKALYDIAIIGGGAAGLMAAVRASDEEKQLNIIVLEKAQEPAKKLYATGNGRCNYLNKNASCDDYYSNERPDYISPVIETIISSSAVPALTQRFRLLGIEPIEEEAGRMYPRSMQAKSIVLALVRRAISAGVEILCGFDTASVTKSDVFVISERGGKTVKAKKVIVATGGKAGIQYGCTGDGYKIAQGFGHKVIKPIPALTSFTVEEDMNSLFGVRTRARISLLSCRSNAFTIVGEDSGEVQLTKDGVSGICTFNISRFYKIEEDVSYQLELDVLEEYSEEKLREMLLERRLRFISETADALFMGLLPDKLGAYILRRSGVQPDLPMADMSIELAERAARIAKALVFNVTGAKGWKDAQVTAGGVALSEIMPGTMESKLVPGLYFAGEVLDADGPCGGYNLTWAFATGFVSGLCAAGALKEEKNNG